MADDIDDAPSEKRKRIAGFFFGVLLALLPVAAGLLLNPSPAVGFTGGRYELLAIGLFVGFSTGHYIGLAIGVSPDENLYAAVGAFLTISVVYALLSYFGTGTIGTLGAIAVLFISTFLLILGHYSGVIADKEQVAKLTKQFAEETSPILLSFIWLLGAIVPPILQFTLPVIGFADIGGALLEGLKWGTAIVVIALAWKACESIQTDSSMTQR
jgi:hypothetical protein